MDRVYVYHVRIRAMDVARRRYASVQEQPSPRLSSGHAPGSSVAYSDAFRETKERRRGRERERERQRDRQRERERAPGLGRASSRKDTDRGTCPVQCT